MQSISELAQQLKPYITQWSLGGNGSGSGGSGGMEIHSISGAYHTGSITNNQGPQFLLTSGQRPMAGNLSMGNNDIDNVRLINGIDINEIATSAAGMIVAGTGVQISGGGLIANSPVISVTLSSVATAMAGKGLTVSGFNVLDVDPQPGFGLKFNDNDRLIVDPTLAGTGLLYDTGQLHINAGSGLTVFAESDKVSVNFPGIAGAGLSYTSTSLGVATGNNIVILGDAVSVDVPSLVGAGLGYSGTTLTVNTGDALEIVSGAVKVKASDLVGPGLNSVGNNLEIRTGAGLELSGNAVAVDLNYNFDWGGLHTHSEKLTSYGAASGVTGYTLFANGNADFRDIQADSLTVDAFIADVNLALAGSEYITKSGATISRDFVTPSTNATLYVFDLLPDTQVFEAGDTVALRYINRGTGLEVGWCWGIVTNYTDLDDGEQSWTFTKISGNTGRTVLAGMWAIDYGVQGDGIIKSTVTDLESPYIDVQTWTLNAYSQGNFTTHLRLGKLDGISDSGLTPSGYGLYSDNAYLHGELVLGNGEVILDQGGLSLGGFEQSKESVNTPEKITWYTDNNNRVPEKSIAQIQGHRGAIVTSEGAMSANLLNTRVYSGYFGGASTGSDWSRIHLESSWLTESGGFSESTSNLIMEGRDNDSRISLSAKVVALGQFYFPQGSSTAVGTDIVLASDVVYPSVTLRTDLGSPTHKFKRLYVDEIVAGTTSSTDTGHNHDDRYYLTSTVDTLLGAKASTTHTHAGYATVTYVDDELAGKSDTSHNHNTLYYTQSQVDALVDGFASDVHTHDDRYYTETEADALLAARALASHTHDFSTVSAHSDLTGIGANDHHNQIHSLDSTDHTGTLSWAKVSKSGSLLSDIGGVLDWAKVSKSGSLLSDIGGSLAWGQLNFTGSDINDIDGDLLWASIDKTGSSLIDLATRNHGDLTGIGTDDHHAQQHALNGADHTGTLSNSQGPQFYLLDGTRSMSGDILNDGGFDQDIGSALAPWRNLHVLNLIAAQLVPTDIMATINGRILVSTSAKLTRDLDASATTIYVDSAIFTNGGYAYLQGVSSGLPQYEAIQFASDATEITANVEYSYTIVRYKDQADDGAIISDFKRSGLDSIAFADAGLNTSLYETIGLSWKVGDGIASLGNDAGDGFIDISSQTSIAGGAGPTISIFNRDSDLEWNSINQVVAMGNLENRLDYNVPTFGFAVGNNLNSSLEQFQGLTATQDGIRLLNSPLSYYGQTDGQTKLQMFLGSSESQPSIKIGPDASQLFTDGFAGPTGVGFQSGYSDDGFMTYISYSPSSKFYATEDGISITGEFNTSAYRIDGNDLLLNGGSQIRLEDASDYEALIDKYDFPPRNAGAAAFNYRYLRLLADEKRVDDSTYASGNAVGVMLEYRNKGDEVHSLIVDSGGITANGPLRVAQDQFSTASGVLVMGASNAAPHVSAAGRVNIWGNSDKISLILEPTNTGAGGSGFSGSVGPNISIGHNTNASLPASGHIAIKNKEGNTFFIWVDGNGNLRFGTNSPNSANDFSGAVIS